MRSVVAVIITAAVCTTSLTAQRAPTSGTDVLQRMHDAYAGKWYHTLTFTQKTTQYRGDSPVVSTWYESLRHTDANGTQLRIDLGDPKLGRGMLYTADSTWRIADSKVSQIVGSGNEFLPLIEGVYMQPVARTVAELKTTGVDMSKVTTGQDDGRPVWIVGASTPSDTTSPQFWVDSDRKVVVRMILSPASNAPPMDIHLDKYVPLANGWLATKVTMLVGGKPRQTEEYSDWKANVDLPAGLFDPATWSTAPHWAKR